MRKIVSNCRRNEYSSSSIAVVTGGKGAGAELLSLGVYAGGGSLGAPILVKGFMEPPEYISREQGAIDESNLLGRRVGGAT